MLILKHRVSNADGRGWTGFLLKIAGIFSKLSLKTLKNSQKLYTKIALFAPKLSQKGTSLQTSLKNSTPMELFFLSAFLCLNFAMSNEKTRVFDKRSLT